MRIFLGQLSPIVGAVEHNLRLGHAALNEGRAQSARIIVLPELVISGYPPRDLLDRQEVLDACRRATLDLASATRDEILIFGTPWVDSGGLRNAAVVAHQGQIVAVVHKTLLPTYDVFDEARHFVSAEENHPVTVGGHRLAITICEDIWTGPEVQTSRRYHLDPVQGLAGCDLAINLSASPFHAGKAGERLELLRHQAARFGCALAYCNQVGGNDELLFDGHSTVVAADGTVLAEGRSFVAEGLAVDLDGPGLPPRPIAFEEEVLGALEMGVRDYASRCGFKTAVLGLSGGIDSALVATIAAAALGPENVHAIAMPGPFSSPGSITDAEALARRLGLPFQVIPIDGIHAAFNQALAPAFAGKPPDVAEENLQARARGTLLMALSNKFGHLLLTTGNKSELAVGYCTLYGDMNGGLAVIADVYKTDVYRLARHINRGSAVIPEATLTKPPSAELRPNQTDQDTLPPYPVLDSLLRAYVEEGASPSEIAKRIGDPALVDRVIGMVLRNEYKRWQAAPALRVSSKAFGMGRRMPLAHGWTARSGKTP